MNASPDKLNKIKHEAFLFIERQKQKLEDKIQKLKKEQEEQTQRKKEEKSRPKSNIGKRENDQIPSYNISENLNIKSALSEINENFIENANLEERKRTINDINEVDLNIFVEQTNKEEIEKKMQDNINMQIKEFHDEKDQSEYSNSLKIDFDNFINDKSKDCPDELPDILDKNKANKIYKLEKEYENDFDNKENIVFQRKNFQIKSFKIRGLQQARKYFKEIKEKSVNFNKIVKLENQISKSKILNNILLLEKTFKKLVFKKLARYSSKLKRNNEFVHIPLMKNFSIKENTKIFLHDFAASLEFKPLESLGYFSKPTIIHESHVEKVEPYKYDLDEEQNKKILDFSNEEEFEMDEKVESYDEEKREKVESEKENCSMNQSEEEFEEEKKEDEQNLSKCLKKKTNISSNFEHNIEENESIILDNQSDLNEENDFEKDMKSENIVPFEFPDAPNENLYSQNCNDFEGSLFNEEIDKEFEENQINISFCDTKCLKNLIQDKFEPQINEEQVTEIDQKKVFNDEEDQPNKYITFTIADQDEESANVNKWELKRKKKLKQLEERKDKLSMQETAEFGKTNNEKNHKKSITELPKKTITNFEIPKTHLPISKNIDNTNHLRNSTKIEFDTHTNSKRKSPNNNTNEKENKKTPLLSTSKIDDPKKNEMNNNKKRPVSSKKFLKNNNVLNIKNAIKIVCLAGEPNKKERELILEKIKNGVSDNQNIIIGFKGWLGRQVFKIN